MHLYLDHLWHPFVLGRGASVQVPFYVGVGGRLWSFSDKDDAFDFNNVPLDIFVQLTAVVDLLFGHNDHFGLHLEGSVGIRYWFD